ncbi:MAG: 50S ribosomal protein L6 [Candidatus Ancaeobacter aquaticus]|nr:50S ribosomal protein L6 [Candidatus Ancaeobacter aquaticus]
MSRIGKIPVDVPQGVEVKVEGHVVKISGPKGKLERTFHNNVSVKLEDSKIEVSRASDIPTDKALHGLTRSLIYNMVFGVTQGFKKTLEIVGVGYRAKVDKNILELSLGFSHPVKYTIPEGVKIDVEKNVKLDVYGIDKELVGEVASEIRRFLPPEPYKGKGIRYSDEHVRRKAGKTVG